MNKATTGITREYTELDYCQDLERRAKDCLYSLARQEFDQATSDILEISRTIHALTDQIQKRKAEVQAQANEKVEER